MNTTAVISGISQKTASDDMDMVKLYSKKILNLSTHMPYTQRLATPQVTVVKRSPLCGSTITIDLTMEKGEITAFAQDVKACALGKATAAIIGSNILGRTGVELRQTRQALTGLLQTGNQIQSSLFPDLEVLIAAHAYPNRHASVMLILDALCEAVERIENMKVL